MSTAQSESIFAQSFEPTTDLSPQHGNTPQIKSRKAISERNRRAMETESCNQLKDMLLHSRPDNRIQLLNMVRNEWKNDRRRVLYLTAQVEALQQQLEELMALLLYGPGIDHM